MADPFGQTAITSVTPGTLTPGETSAVQITGNKTNFDSTSVVSFSGSGITAGVVSVASAVSLSVPVTLALGAEVGPCDVTVATGSEVVTGAGMFTVEAAPPATIFVSPATMMRGTADTVQINGTNTHFDNTSVVSFAGQGITVSAVAILSPTTLRANLTIDPDAELGTSHVEVTTGGVEVATGGVFTVELNPDLVKVSGVSPGSAAQGTLNLVVDITGQHTHFGDTSVVSFAGAGITISAFNLVSPTAMQATLNIDPTAEMGTSDVTVTTGAEVATGTDVFTVLESTEKAIVLREAVNTYLRQNHIADQAAVEICEGFIANVNEALRGQAADKSGVFVTVGRRS